MTELIEHTQVEHVEAGSPGSPPPRHRTGPFRRGPHAFVVLVAVVIVAGAATGFALSGSGSSAASATSVLRSIKLASPSYTPQKVYGTDDYHCNLVNPHVTRDAFVVWSDFSPGSSEVHHAVLSVVPPSLAAKALSEKARAPGTRDGPASVLRRYQIPRSPISSTPPSSANGPRATARTPCRKGPGSCSQPEAS